MSYVPETNDTIVYDDDNLFGVWHKDDVTIYFKNNFKRVIGSSYEKYTIGTTRKATDIANELVIEYYRDYVDLLRQAQGATEDVFG
jgi:hypothetical protein